MKSPKKKRKDSRVHQKSPSKKTKDEELLDRYYFNWITSKNRNKALREMSEDTDFRLLNKRLKKAGSSTSGRYFKQQTPSEIDDVEIGQAIKSKFKKRKVGGRVMKKNRFGDNLVNSGYVDIKPYD